MASLQVISIRRMLMVSSIMYVLVLAQSTTSAAQGAGESFPDGISPSDVFARMDLVNRCLDRLLDERNITAPSLPPQMETQLGPLHVYQMVLACSVRVQELGDQAGVLAVPTLSAKPRLYAPRDVLYVTDLMLEGLRRVAATFDVEDLPTDEASFSDMSPTDVFNQASSVFLKLNALCGYDDISPSEVYAEMVRIADDVRSVLRQADSESRYRVDAPPSEPGKIPADVFNKCLDIRTAMNKHRLDAGLPEVPLATAPGDYEIRPRDVYFQTQIIIAELNLLKLHTGTISSTPLAIPVKSAKDPMKVHEQASLIEYLLGQVNIDAEQ